MDIYLIAGYVGAVLTGLVLGLLGGGGALMSIPVLVYLFHIPASVATGYSLFLVGVTASSGAIQNIRNKMVNYKAMVSYGVPSMVAVYSVRRFLIPNLPQTILQIGSFSLSKDHFILLLLSIVMMLAGYKMITNSGEIQEDDSTHKEIDILRLGLFAILIGSFLGLVGAGGGFLMIPALVFLAHLPMKKAVGTSLVLVSVNSLVGFLGEMHSAQTMDWKFLLLFSAFSIFGIFAGIQLHHRIHAHTLRKYFGWMMLLMGIGIITKEFVLS